MSETFTFEMLPAEEGDCLWITWRDGGTRRHLVVDGGPPDKSPLRARVERAIAEEGGRLSIDLLVVTHIDDDHIGGVVDLLERPPTGLSVEEIWFNGYKHLRPDLLGVPRAERLSAAIERLRIPWNESLPRQDGWRAAVVRPNEPLPRVVRRGGLALTLLSPTPELLSKLAVHWEAALGPTVLAARADAPPEPRAPDELGRRDPWPPAIDALVARRFEEDGAPANGSSIAMLVELGSRAVLLGADAYPSVLTASIRRLPRERLHGGRLRLDALKLPHHGSRANLSDELLAAVECDRYLVSTSGRKFAHPDTEALARVVARGGPQATLCLNHRVPTTTRWAGITYRGVRVRTEFPSDAGGGYTVAW